MQALETTPWALGFKGSLRMLLGDPLPSWRMEGRSLHFAWTGVKPLSLAMKSSALDWRRETLLCSWMQPLCLPLRVGVNPAWYVSKTLRINGSVILEITFLLGRPTLCVDLYRECLAWIYMVPAFVLWCLRLYDGVA